ncbi:hypothetical protein D3C85_1678080 [compost metagenome]
MQDDARFLRQIIGNQRRRADAQVHEGVSGQMGRYQPGHVLSRQAVHVRSAIKTLSTKMQGVMIASGSRLPAATISPASTTTVSAAVAMTAW